MATYASNARADAAMAVLRAFVRQLIRWPRVQDEQISGLAKCLVVLDEFPHVDRRLSVSISFREPVRELDEGEQQVFWNITIEPTLIEADISGFLKGERGSDSLTMCEFTAVEGQAQYDDYRRVHGQAVPDLYLPGFDATTLDALPWDADECSLTVDE